VLHIGGNDLLANMGKPGKFDDPALVEAQERVIAACRNNGIFAGCGGNRDVARQVDLIKRGCQFVTTQSDIGFWRRRRRHGRRGFATGWPDGSLRQAATKSRIPARSGPRSMRMIS
jgi:2-keto-3-deoxy-L-rhamnonate aldolase RhmA